MIEIGGFIHQLNVRKTQKKDDNGDSIFIAQCDKKRSNSTNDKDEIGVISKRLNPIKSVIAEKEFGFDIEFRNPTIKHKPNYANQHHQPKKYTKDRKRCGRCAFLEIF